MALQDKAYHTIPYHGKERQGIPYHAIPYHGKTRRDIPYHTLFQELLEDLIIHFNLEALSQEIRAPDINCI